MDKKRVGNVLKNSSKIQFLIIFRNKFLFENSNMENNLFSSQSLNKFFFFPKVCQMYFSKSGKCFLFSFLKFKNNFPFF